LTTVGRAKTAMVVAGAIVVGGCRGLCCRVGVGRRSGKDIRVTAIGCCHGRDEYDRDLSFIGGVRGTGNVHVGGVFPEIDTDAVTSILVDQRL